MPSCQLDEFSFYDEASPNIVAGAYYCSLIRNSAKPSFAYPLKMTLLFSVDECRQYGSKTKSPSVTIYTMVLMDGTKGICKAVLNSGLSQKFENIEDPCNGSTIIVTDAEWIFMQPHEDGTRRGILFVNAFDWKAGPVNASEEASTVTPDFCSSWIDTSTIDKCHTDSDLLFLESFYHEKDFWYWTMMDAEKVHKGMFLKDDPVRQAAFLKREREDIVEHLDCSCENDPFFFLHCITKLHPLHCVNVDMIYDQAKRRLHGDMEADNFEGLSNSHKRWCFYWYFAVNFFHLKCASRRLRDCFVRAVRDRFPDNNGKYTGFKTATERAAKFQRLE